MSPVTHASFIAPLAVGLSALAATAGPAGADVITDWNQKALPIVTMHPEYPCAHCIVAGTAGTVMQAVFGTGTLPEFSLTTPTAPGVTHRWTRLEDYIAEPSNARIWSGIHYRFSTKVGTEMGRKIADYTVQNYLRPLK